MKNKLAISSKCQQWIKLKGKGKIQSFQDSFAEWANISLCLLSIDGNNLTVWSNFSLLCDHMTKNYQDRCIDEHQKIINNVLKSKKTCIFTCYMGLTYFACPIFYNNDIVAVYFGGSVYLEENKNLYNYNASSNIPTINLKKLNDIMKMLENILHLCNMNQNTLKTSEPRNAKSDMELSFLQKKLSVRELEITKLIINGLTNKEIAMKLYISEKTVKTHVNHILKKLKLKNRVQIMIFCKQNNVT